MRKIYLIDGSTWVEYLCQAGSKTHEFIRELILADAPPATTEPIAAVALRTDSVLVHCDRDFDHLAEVYPRLRVQRHDQS